MLSEAHAQAPNSFKNRVKHTDNILDDAISNPGRLPRSMRLKDEVEGEGMTSKKEWLSKASQLWDILDSTGRVLQSSA